VNIDNFDFDWRDVHDPVGFNWTCFIFILLDLIGPVSFLFNN
jgi:hypothetical protein